MRILLPMFTLFFANSVFAARPAKYELVDCIDKMEKLNLSRMMKFKNGGSGVRTSYLGAQANIVSTYGEIGPDGKEKVIVRTPYGKVEIDQEKLSCQTSANGNVYEEAAEIINYNIEDRAGTLRLPEFDDQRKEKIRELAKECDEVENTSLKAAAQRLAVLYGFKLNKVAPGSAEARQ